MNAIVTTLCVAAVTWVWWGMGVANALNVILVYTWAIILPGALVMVFAGDERFRDVYKEGAYYSWPFAISEVRNLAMGTLMVWEGWLVSGVVWLFAAAAIEFGRVRWTKLNAQRRSTPDGDAREAGQ